MSNLPILYQNILLIFPRDEVQRAFIWAADCMDKTKTKYKAEEYAREVEILLGSIPKLIDMSSEIYVEQLGIGIKFCQKYDLIKFMMTRHANRFWGGNINMSWMA